MVKVLTGPGETACMADTIVVESMPPERKAPTGTSATSRRSTAERSSRSSSSTASCSDPTKGSDEAASTTSV